MLLLGWLFPNWCQHNETWLQTWHKKYGKESKKIDKWRYTYHLLCLESRLLLPLWCMNKLTIFLCIIWATKHPKCCLFQPVHYWPVFLLHQKFAKFQIKSLKPRWVVHVVWTLNLLPHTFYIQFDAHHWWFHCNLLIRPFL